MHSITTKPVKEIIIEKIVKIYKRRFEHKDIGLEVICEKNHVEKSNYFSFEERANRDEIYDAIIKRVAQSCLGEINLNEATEKW
jgi:hypothetical protein